MVTAFTSAVETGDLDALLRALDPEVVWRADGGGVAPAARRVLTGAHTVAKLVLGIRRSRRVVPVPAVVNGTLGFVVEQDGEPVAVMAFDVADGKIREIDVVANPAKLRRVGTS